MAGGGVTLETVWHVNADASYDVVRHWKASQHLVAVRTLSGRGRLYREDGQTLDVGPGSLMLFKAQRVRRYHCVGNSWQFWWFEFAYGGPLAFPLWTPLLTPVRGGEAALLREIFTALRREASAQRMLASAGLLLLLHRWWAGARDQGRQPRHQAMVERMIEAMHERTNRLWRVGDMARLAGLSERRFRQVFEATTGQSPKRFHAGLRLELGRQLLRAGPVKLAEVADRLGFSSAFHFSRAFANRFGHPPSCERE
ncbi:MAG: AraC family transcriptional regulator [bacterium]